jgi:hypothetical protein
MKRNSAIVKSAADQRLTLPLSAAWAPELIAVRIAAVLMPPRADITISRFKEPYISRRTSLKKDIFTSNADMNEAKYSSARASFHLSVRGKSQPMI